MGVEGRELSSRIRFVIRDVIVGCEGREGEAWRDVCREDERGVQGGSPAVQFLTGTCTHCTAALPCPALPCPALPTCRTSAPLPCSHTASPPRAHPSYPLHVQDLRRSNWVPRRETFTAKKLDEVRAQAEAELGMISSVLQGEFVGGKGGKGRVREREVPTGAGIIGAARRVAQLLPGGEEGEVQTRAPLARAEAGQGRFSSVLPVSFSTLLCATVSSARAEESTEACNPDLSSAPDASPSPITHR